MQADARERVRRMTAISFGRDVSGECIDCVYFRPERTKNCASRGTARGYGEHCDTKIKSERKPAHITELCNRAQSKLKISSK